MKAVIRKDILQMQKLQACIRETEVRIEGTAPISVMDERLLHEVLFLSMALKLKIDERVTLLSDYVKRTEVAREL
jgi:hypothetical protein